MAIVSIFYGLSALVGYLIAFDTLYRPFINGPATNPLTAICMTLTGFGLLYWNKMTAIWLRRIALLAVIVISSTRMFDVMTHSSLSELITPFQNQVILELEMGKRNSMGFNSALMFELIALSLILGSFQKFFSSQFIAFISLALPSVSFIGHIYGIHGFYGEMSFFTTTIGFILTIAALVTTAQYGALKAILSPYIGGTLARFQSILGYSIPIALGYFLIKSISTEETELFGVFVISICWFIIFLVSLSAIVQEEVDKGRRIGERLLTKAAMTDHLTGLANRRKFVEFGMEALNRIQRSKQQLWLLMLDIDHFKTINDTAGHDMGDKVLVEISQALKNSVRNVDLVSRIGGEEFSIILTDTTSQGAKRISDNILSTIEKVNIEAWTDIHGPVTISIGCAFNDGEQTLDQTITLADNALYQAKQNGRNQVAFADQND